ncbi:YgaP family membrane protein [Paracoccus jiaweipingae]|uniref:YgaP family membrane protein n=1 Tax=unclassified Paracoccus (in: a-proteobacteria) TaxID=2688777 RepID=UPI00379C35CD
MTKNMGNIDRILRLIVAAVLLYLAFGTQYAAAGALHWIAIVVAAVFIVTSLIGNCPLYSIIGIKTCPRS